MERSRYAYDHVYEPGYDDTPPSSPKYKPAPPTLWQRISWMFHKWRGLMLASIIFFGATYWWRQRRTPLFTPKHAPSLRYKNVDWRLYAYSQYATDSHYLCNAIMVFDQLDRLGSKAQKLLLYPNTMDLEVHHAKDRDSQLLRIARDKYGVKLTPVALEGMRTDNRDDPSIKSDEDLDMQETWDTSITKFLTFKQTQYLRILHLDSDISVLKNMDDLFLLPAAPVGMPRAYWKLPAERSLSSLLVLMRPSEREAQRLFDAAEAETRANLDFDTEILNSLYRDSAMVLPHRAYGLLSSEFRSKNHTNYHGNGYEVWHPDRALAEASLVYFSDWPLPKPWIMWPNKQLETIQPECDYMSGTSKESGCRNREVWLELYHSFRRRRKDVCGLLSVPAPEYPPPEKQKEREKEKEKEVT